MSKPKPSSKTRDEERLHSLGQKKRALKRAARERKEALRQAEREKRRRTDQLFRERKRMALDHIKAEIGQLISRLRVEQDKEERIGLKAELAHLRQLREQMRGRHWSKAHKRRRKPPEAGLPVPAIPPRGPNPMQGGAAAALDFGAD